MSNASDQGLAVSPSSPAVRVGEQASLTATPLEDITREPEWEIEEPHGGGFLNSRGFQVTYVAPVSAGRYHLILRATRPDGSHVKSVEEIRVLPDPQIDPIQARVAPGGSLAFTARMKGLPRNTVTWKVEEAGGGTIGEDGSYRAPQTPGTYHVTATSTLDREAVAMASVVVE